MTPVEISLTDIVILIFPIAWRFYKFEVFKGNWRKIFSNFLSGIVFIVELSGLAWIFLFFLKASVWSLGISLLFAGISNTRALDTGLMILFILVDFLVDRLRFYWGMKINDKSIGKASSIFLDTFTNIILTSFIFALGALILFLGISITDRDLLLQLINE